VAPNEEQSLARSLGQLEGTVGGLKEQAQTLIASVDGQRTTIEALSRDMADTRAAQLALATDAKTARELLADAAKEAKSLVVHEANERRDQHHWIIERSLQALPVIIAAVTAVLGYMFAKGGL
jgi:chromosome segregation ATPase